MTKLKFLLLIFLLILTAACTEQKATLSGAPVADSEENRLAAAKEYLKIAPPQELLQSITAGVTEKLPEPLRQPFQKVISSQSLQEATYQVILKGLVKNFTANEIKAMTAFYSTPEGKSIRQKENAYRSEVLTGINMEVMNAFKQEVKPEQLKELHEPKSGEPKQTPERQPSPQPQAPAHPGKPPAAK